MTETTNLELKKPEKTNFVSIGDFNLNSDKIDKLGAPEFDDSGVVDGITDFTTYLSTLVSGSSIFNFFRNLKAGFQYVLHVGQLVNNTVTNNDNLPASASAVYKLQQSLNTTNSNLENKFTDSTVPFTISSLATGASAQFVIPDKTGYLLVSTMFALPGASTQSIIIKHIYRQTIVVTNLSGSTISSQDLNVYCMWKKA